MSELGDKERRFVEDQRRVEGYVGRDQDAFDAGHSAGEISVWKSTFVKNALEKVQKQDALLAEAAEVLRAIDKIVHRYRHSEGAQIGMLAFRKITGIHDNRAKPLLDKLGERE